jgi:hypothetical protein
MLARPTRNRAAGSARVAKSVPQCRRLQTIAGVSSALAGCLQALELGLMAPAKARVLIHGYDVLARVIQGTELELRIRSLEAAVREDDDAST